MYLKFSAWVPDEGIFPYADNREKFIPTKRIPNGFKEAVDAIDDALKKNPENVSIFLSIIINEYIYMLIIVKIVHFSRLLSLTFGQSFLMFYFKVY